MPEIKPLLQAKSTKQRADILQASNEYIRALLVAAMRMPGNCDVDLIISRYTALSLP